jgi:hypothetical protein
MLMLFNIGMEFKHKETCRQYCENFQELEDRAVNASCIELHANLSGTLQKVGAISCSGFRRFSQDSICHGAVTRYPEISDEEADRSVRNILMGVHNSSEALDQLASS